MCSWYHVNTHKCWNTFICAITQQLTSLSSLFIWAMHPRIMMGHYSEVIVSAVSSQISSVLIVCSTVCPGADQRKHQSCALLAYVREVHRWPMISPQKGPVTWKMYQLGDVMIYCTRFDKYKVISIHWPHWLSYNSHYFVWKHLGCSSLLLCYQFQQIYDVDWIIFVAGIIMVVSG